MYEILFHGAAGEVTGSMHMIRFNNQWIALDVGLFHGRRAETEIKNRAWPVPPREIAAVVLSHAHIDHSGRLPRLVKDGFDGPIYCTQATLDLCSIMLADSAHIQQEDAQYVTKAHRKKGLPPAEPLYTFEDTQAAMKLMQSVGFDRSFTVIPGLSVCFNEAGHMLGAGGVRLEFRDTSGRSSTLYFSGDVGRPDVPILRDPNPFPLCETVICESTYGGRVNEMPEDATREAQAAIQRTYQRGGKVIVPAFSVGRTQMLVYLLRRAWEINALPRMPVYVDSPLAVDATEVYRLHPECYDHEAAEFQKRVGDLLTGDGLIKYIRDVEESKRLNFLKEPCIIISASGMCESGRIRHHLKNNIQNSRNLILIPGYQAENTLGRKLVDGVKRVNLFGDSYDVHAEVLQIHGFSGHADQTALIQYLTPLKGVARRVFLVHGEPDQSRALAGELHKRGFAGVEPVEKGRRVPVA